MAAVTEAAPALPEIADTEEESELAEEPAIAPPGKPPLQHKFMPRMCHCVSLGCGSSHIAQSARQRSVWGSKGQHCLLCLRGVAIRRTML